MVDRVSNDLSLNPLLNGEYLQSPQYIEVIHRLRVFAILQKQSTFNGTFLSRLEFILEKLLDLEMG